MSSRTPKRKVRAGIDRHGRTPLHIAVIDQKHDIVNDKLGNKPDINTQDDNGWTPLHFAANSNSIEILDALIAAGANLELCDEFGNTPLFRAVFNSRGNGEMIKSLLKAGASPDSQNKKGTSPLMLAQRIVNYPIIQFFVRHS